MTQSLLTQPYQRGSPKLHEKSIRCRLIDLGLIDYGASFSLQKELLASIKNKTSLDALIFCEHPHTFTLGRLSKKDNILCGEEGIKKRGISVNRVDRGGEVTYHGPGQLVVYPIFNLSHYKKDLKFYLDTLENVIIATLLKCNVHAEKRPSFRGAWIDGKKIASIGIAVHHWITCHGLALNVNTDLSYFSMIRPCGLDITMTSIESVLGNTNDISKVKQVMLDNFVKSFNLEIMEGGK
ncbi:lipoyl(octanoyl) transferase LipB [Candidatus Omnitrophota bacterium]